MAVTKQALDKAAKLFAANDIHSVEVAFPDTQGQMRGKRIPASFFLRKAAESGFANANAVFYWDHHCNLRVLPSYDPAVHIVDMVVKPDLSTLKAITWRPGSALCFADCIDEHTHMPVAMDQRSLVRAQVERANSLELEPIVATEMEFYLLTEDWKLAYDSIQYVSLTKAAEYDSFLCDLTQKLEAFGLVVEACNTEYGPAQFEINLGYGPALEVADATMVFKSIVKEMARQHGYRATFMSKPFAGISGNGMHVHHSFQRAGKNVYQAKTDDGTLGNKTMRDAVAGLCARACEMALIANPTVNAYKRIEDYSFAPKNVSWGGDNRNVAIRTIPQVGAGSRIEYRCAAADASAHLVVASVIAAALDGIEGEFELPPASAVDAYQDASQTPLPRTMREAIDVFRSGSFAASTFGEHFAANFAGLAEHEATVFESQIHDWEFTRYVEYA